jgi:hypothetical protein
MVERRSFDIGRDALSHFAQQDIATVDIAQRP